MLLKNLAGYLALGASCALAATNIAEAISDMDNLARAIGDARDSLQNYKGGVSGALDTASAVNNAKLAARTARENLAGSDGFTPDEAAQYYEAYTKMSPVLLDALTVAKDKVRRTPCLVHNLLTLSDYRRLFTMRLEWVHKPGSPCRICTVRRRCLRNRQINRFPRRRWARLLHPLSRSARPLRRPKLHSCEDFPRLLLGGILAGREVEQ